jgi:hypothetical protein
MTLSDPLLFLLYRESREEVCTSVGSWGDVEDASEDVGNLESQETEGHVCEALALLGEFGHAWVQIGIVDVQRL